MIDADTISKLKAMRDKTEFDIGELCDCLPADGYGNIEKPHIQYWIDANTNAVRTLLQLRKRSFSGRIAK